MDIQGIVEQLAEKIKAEPDILAQIKADPIKTIEKLIGVVVPEGSIKEIISGLEAKLKDGAIEGAEEKLKEHGGIAGIFDAIKKLF